MKGSGLFFCLVVFAITGFTQSPSPAPVPSIGDVKVKPIPEMGPRADNRSSYQLDPYTRPDAKTRRKRFFNSTLGPLALGRSVATAGIATWRNSPEEWGTKWEGFGRRLASNVGRNAIKQTTIYGLDEAFKVDSHYYRSKNKSVGARIRNALISPVTARKANGERTIGVPRLVGTYGASVVAYETWYPKRYDWKDGVRSGTISLGFNAAFNLFKEFVWKK